MTVGPIEPQNQRFFAQFSCGFRLSRVSAILASWWLDLSQTALQACLRLRALVKLRQIQPTPLLLFEQFQPAFELFQPPS